MLGCIPYLIIAFSFAGYRAAAPCTPTALGSWGVLRVLMMVRPPADHPGNHATEIEDMMNVSVKSSHQLVFLLTALSIALPVHVQSEVPSKTSVELVSPVPGTVAISRTPTILFRSSRPLQAEGRLILLDGNDVTAMISEDQTGYRFTPLGPLPAGEHTIQVFASDLNGNPVEQELTFATRHSQPFEELSSEHRLSATLKTVLHRHTSGNDSTASPSPETESPYTTLDSYLSSNSTIREGEWRSSFRTNLRYYEQNGALRAPEKKGLGLIDFLVSSDYTATKYAARVEIGDTTVESSKNTVDHLTRRGAQSRLSVGNLTMSGFGVLGRENTYEIDGLGLAFNSNDHIMGVSANMDFFDKKMSIKAVHVRGGEEGNYLGTWSEAQRREGDVTGIVVTTDFFRQQLMTDFELDASNFNVDADHNETTVADAAYRLRAGGFINQADYEFGYTYTGPQYEVVGNQSIIKDWAGYLFNGGTTLADHGFRLLLNYSWDNVEDDRLFARIYSLTSGIEYRYSGWQRFPVGLLLEHNQQRSTDEPVGIDPTDLDTDSITGRVGFVDGPWAIELRPAYSEQNDATANDFDTRIYSVSIVPSYVSPLFYLLPSWTLNRSQNLVTDVWLDSNTVTLDIYAGLFRNQVVAELGGTYDWSKADDNSINTNTASLYGRLNYRLEQWRHLEDATIAVEYLYQRQQDKIYDTTLYEGILSLVLSSAIPYSY